MAFQKKSYQLLLNTSRAKVYIWPVNSVFDGMIICRVFDAF